MTQLAIVTDLDRCTGCHACTVACAQENGLKAAAFWTRVEERGPSGNFPQLRLYYIPIACQHCAEPACVAVCPTGASHKRSDGIVLIDREKCIGCQSCLKTCPYKAPYFDADANKTEKCTLCAHLVDHGEKPACVKTCTTWARAFGDISDAHSDAAKLLQAAGSHVYRLRATRGTRPSTCYILRTGTWSEEQ